MVSGEREWQTEGGNFNISMSMTEISYFNSKSTQKDIANVFSRLSYHDSINAHV